MFVYIARFIRKQGVNQLFHECENHVWRLGMKKALPSGIVYDGGSDWFGLHREFLEYVVSSNDLLVTGMLEFSKYSFSPLEVNNDESCYVERYLQGIHLHSLISALAIRL